MHEWLQGSDFFKSNDFFILKKGMVARFLRMVARQF